MARKFYTLVRCFYPDEKTLGPPARNPRASGPSSPDGRASGPQTLGQGFGKVPGEQKSSAAGRTSRDDIYSRPRRRVSAARIGRAGFETTMCEARLSLRVRGGLSNQRECIVNAGIAAHMLGVPLVLPRLDLIGRGNEQFAPKDAHYVHPWDSHASRGAFGQLYDQRHAAQLLDRAGVVRLIRLRDSNGEPLETVTLPPIEQIVPGCTLHKGSGRGASGRNASSAIETTCEARASDRSLLDALLARWRRVMTTRCPSVRAKPARAVGAAGLPSLPPPAPTPVVFNAGLSLCWNVYKSRHTSACKRQFAVCDKILDALQWNHRVSSLHSRILAHLDAHPLAAAAAAQMRPAWVAVHVRAFVCAQNRRVKPSFSHVLDSLRRLGVQSGLLYLVSSVALSSVQAALPSFTVVSKETVLGDETRLDYPFEVCAAIDYGVAVAAPVYLGEPGQSSFDAFADEERRRNNRSSVRRIVGACAAASTVLEKGGVPEITTR